MNHEKYMKLALEQAKLAYEKKEVPIGAIIVQDGEVIASAHNLREQSNRAIAHAEVLAIEEANKKLNSWRLDRCVMYVTIEPCPMCAGAIIQSRITEVVYGSKDFKSGSHESIVDLFDRSFNHKVKITPGVMENECGQILSDFFKSLRNKN